MTQGQEVINRTIKAIKADAGRRLKMAEFCSASSRVCDTSFCLAGWVVVSQPDFNYKQMLKELAEERGPLTWKSATTRHGMDIAIREKAAALLPFDPTTIFNLFYFYIGEDCNRMNLILKRIGININRDGNVLDYFDIMPQEVRMNTAVKVLEILRDTGKVNWLDAIEYAVNRYVGTKRRPS